MLRPLFGRFIFVRIDLSDADWQRLLDLDGVQRFMTQAGAVGVPAAIPDAAIESVWKLPGMAANGCVYPPGRFEPDYQGEEIAAGVTTRLLDGPLADRVGVCEWSSTRRVQLLTEIFGRAGVRVTAQRRNVVTVD